MKTTKYKEYLGDIEDPFPTVSYKNRTYLSIQPPPFSEAVDAIFSSGEISVSAKLQRQPLK
ncbi:hypothetical protein OBV_04130 [Oscillibacter valericigenes Sjm18-20]|nr:hypothetical protein OBV_04130 [Oscillibacter valericigenes Sjm18-20]